MRGNPLPIENPPIASAWHTQATTEVLAALSVDTNRGLTNTEAALRLQQQGPNAIDEGKRRTWWQMLISQFTDFMVVVLIVAALISGLIGEPTDTAAILVIIALNAAIGVIQEFRAERSMASLRAMATPAAMVLRDGELQKISSRDVVAGDILLLEEGNTVAADSRLLDVQGLEVDESALTGESQPVSKIAGELSGAQTNLGDRLNMAYTGTLVTRGRAKGVVVATGMHTELGGIAALLQRQDTLRTPLQQRLRHFSQRLAYGVLAICALIFFAGILRDEPPLLMLLTAISLAVAAVPEALPAVATIGLALGAGKMSRLNALIRHLPAVETLGSITYICSDKTGTLTQNVMRVERVVIGDTIGDTLAENARQQPGGQRLGQALALSNSISAAPTAGATARVVGEPTELALFNAAAAWGFDQQTLQRALPRCGEIAFDSHRKRMTTLHRDGDTTVAFCKGAPEVVLPLCSIELVGEQFIPVDVAARLRQANALAQQGFRVIALAYRQWPRSSTPSTDAVIESELTLLALVGLIDPPRPEAKAAVQECISAGIHPVMITGDHPSTAQFIAQELGIIDGDGEVMTGDELERLEPAALLARVENTRVYARVNPEQKIKIVEALQARGQCVAMTGDGVNDAPALKGANIGVAMGKKGTDVAREAAAMVLLDDNFATIVAAIREGRRIFDNIRKFIKYAMAGNSGEILLLTLAPFFGLPIPLLPIHILWVNLVTDGLPGLALTVEPAERNLMQRPPRPPQEPLLAGGLWQHILWMGLLIAGLSLFAQHWALQRGSENWQTMVFTVLTLSQLLHVMAIRSETQSLFNLGLFSNPSLLTAVVLTAALQLLLIYLPAANAIFKTAPLSADELALCLLLPVAVPLAVEVEKWVRRRRARAEG